jgi:hypothetical protein
MEQEDMEQETAPSGLSSRSGWWLNQSEILDQKIIGLRFASPSLLFEQLSEYSLPIAQNEGNENEY